MTKFKLIFESCLLGIVLMATVVFVSCDDDGGTPPTPTPTTGQPTIVVSSSAVGTNGVVEGTVGTAIAFGISVNAKEGLSSVKLNDTDIKTYDGTDTTDLFTYRFTPATSGDTTLVFSVTDAKNQSKESSGIRVSVAQGGPILVLDFAGEATGMTSSQGATDCTISDPKSAEVGRQAVEFNASGLALDNKPTYEATNAKGWFGTAYTTEPLSSGAITTGVDNPDADAPTAYKGKVTKFTKKFAGWSWNRTLVNLKKLMDEDVVKSLPTMDTATGNTYVAGSKVMKLDVYYEDSGSASYDSVAKDTCYTVDIILVDYEEFRCNHDGWGMYIGYSACITAADTWQTITFEKPYVAKGFNNFFNGSGSKPNENAEAGDVNGIALLFGRGNDGDLKTDNATYFRNLRIEDIE